MILDLTTGFCMNCSEIIPDCGWCLNTSLTPTCLYCIYPKFLTSSNTCLACDQIVTSCATCTLAHDPTIIMNYTVCGICGNNMFTSKDRLSCGTCD